jgi:hypothetical protein
MTVINLDAKRAERKKKAKAPPTLKLGGETFKLPAEMPLAAFSPMRVGDVEGYLRGLLGDEQWQRFSAHGLSLEDTEEISKGIGPLYGLQNGKVPEDEPEPEAE